MKTYISKNIKFIFSISLIMGLLYAIVFQGFTAGFFFSFFLEFVALLLFLSIIDELNAKEILFFIFLCIGIALIYLYLLTGFLNEHNLFFTGIIFNVTRFFMLTSGFYVLIKDVYNKKINLIILPMYFIYGVNMIFNIV